MATNILMPALSPTMTEGTLTRWLKKEGDQVSAGDLIAEIETDKATMEVEAVDEGVLGRILVPDGTEGVKVNDPIAILVDDGEEVPSGAVTPRRCRPPRRPSRRRQPRPRETAPVARCRNRHPPVPAVVRRRPARCCRRSPAPQPRTGPQTAPPRQRHRPHAAATATTPVGSASSSRPWRGAMAQQAGLDLSRAEGQRAERADRQGGYRGGDAAWPARRRPGRATRGGAGRRLPRLWDAPPRRPSPRRTSWCRTAACGRSSPAG